MSVKYQVLIDSTAMIGVVKQKDKSTGEMKTFEKALEKVKRPALVELAPAFQAPVYNAYSAPMSNAPTFDACFGGFGGLGGNMMAQL